jgi:hypothetical protein
MYFGCVPWAINDVRVRVPQDVEPDAPQIRTAQRPRPVTLHEVVVQPVSCSRGPPLTWLMVSVSLR